MDLERKPYSRNDSGRPPCVHTLHCSQHACNSDERAAAAEPPSPSVASNFHILLQQGQLRRDILPDTGKRAGTSQDLVIGMHNPSRIFSADSLRPSAGTSRGRTNVAGHAGRAAVQHQHRLGTGERFVGNGGSCITSRFCFLVAVSHYRGRFLAQSTCLGDSLGRGGADVGRCT